MSCRIGLLLFCCLVASLSYAESSVATENQALQLEPVELDIPVVDLPYNAQTYFPNLYSMRQSLAFSTDFYELAHTAIVGPDLTSGRRWWIVGFDLLADYIPLGNGWLHEEWHRSVMSNRGIGSFNDINTFPIGRSLISVSHVADKDLVQLKLEHPADQVRLSSAGMESQTEQNILIERHHFFAGRRGPDQLLMLLNTVNVASYINECASTRADTATDDQNREDGRDVLKRDFTGLDCTAWVYDLFRPDEPYSARGVHPSGVGINRYIHYSDLNQKEKDFLQLQSRLNLLNFADPFLYQFTEFDGHWGQSNFKWNAKLSHYLTSFGGVVDASVFLKIDKQKYLVVLHNGLTDTRYLPGISLEDLDRTWINDSISISTRLTIWPQPRDQRIETTETETLVYASAELNYEVSKTFSTYLGINAKTAGWEAGEVSLDRSVSILAGFKTTVF